MDDAAAAAVRVFSDRVLSSTRIGDGDDDNSQQPSSPPPPESQKPFRRRLRLLDDEDDDNEDDVTNERALQPLSSSFLLPSSIPGPNESSDGDNSNQTDDEENVASSRDYYYRSTNKKRARYDPREPLTERDQENRFEWRRRRINSSDDDSGGEDEDDEFGKRNTGRSPSPVTRSPPERPPAVDDPQDTDGAGENGRTWLCVCVLLCEWATLLHTSNLSFSCFFLYVRVCV